MTITARLRISDMYFIYEMQCECTTDMNRSSYQIATFFRYYLRVFSVKAVLVPRIVVSTYKSFNCRMWMSSLVSTIGKHYEYNCYKFSGVPPMDELEL